MSAAHALVNMSDFDKFLQRFDTFEKNISSRLDALEVKDSGDVTSEAQSGSQAAQNSQAGIGQQAAVENQEQNGGAGAANFVQFPGEKLLQDQFKTIKDTLAKVKLPLGFKTDFSLRGVGRNHTGSAKLINNCCEYAETLMKYVLCMQVGDQITDEHVNTLMNILAAQIKFLQSEKAVCFVNGKFGENFGTLFREFKSHTSVFSPEDVQVLEHVTQLANSQNSSQRGRGRGYRGGYRNSNSNSFNSYGGNRYSWRGGFNGRSNYNNRGSGTDGGNQDISERI